VRLGAVVFGMAAVCGASATELSDRTFFTGNDVYDWCRSDRHFAEGYVSGMFDEAAHGAFLIEGFKSKYSGKYAGANMDYMIDLALDRIVGYCAPERVRLEQVTDVFCNYLRDNPDKRSGLPSIMFSEALTKAWPCHGK
jgi:hypothetical protein